MYKRIRFLFSFLDDNGELCYKFEGDTNYFKVNDTIRLAGSDDGFWFIIKSIEDDIMELDPIAHRNTVVLNSWYIYKHSKIKYHPGRDRYRGKLKIIGWSPYKLNDDASNAELVLDDLEFYTFANGFSMARIYNAVHRYLHRYGDKWIVHRITDYHFYSCDLFVGTFIIKV